MNEIQMIDFIHDVLLKAHEDTAVEQNKMTYKRP